MMSKAKARAAAAADRVADKARDARAALDASQENVDPQQSDALPPPPTSSSESWALPDGWEAEVSRSTGDTYYINTVTGESQYEYPIADEPADDGEDSHRRDSLKERAQHARQLARTKAAQAGKLTAEQSRRAAKTLSNSEKVGAVRDAAHRAAQSKTGGKAVAAASRARAEAGGHIAHFRAVLPVLSAAGDVDDEDIVEDGFDEQDPAEAQSALEEMSRQVSSRLVDMTELLEEEKELRQEAEAEQMRLKIEMEQLRSSVDAPAEHQQEASPLPLEVLSPTPVPEPQPTAAAPAAAPDAELALPSPACSEAETEASTPTDTGVPVERRTYTPSDEELREGIMLLREETPGMGMGKMRKAFQSRRQWAVSEKRLRATIRSIETGVRYRTPLTSRPCSARNGLSGAGAGAGGGATGFFVSDVCTDCRWRWISLRRRRSRRLRCSPPRASSCSRPLRGRRSSCRASGSSWPTRASR